MNPRDLQYLRSVSQAYKDMRVRWAEFQFNQELERTTASAYDQGLMVDALANAVVDRAIAIMRERGILPPE